MVRLLLALVRADFLNDLTFAPIFPASSASIIGQALADDSLLQVLISFTRFPSIVLKPATRSAKSAILD